MSVRVPFTAWCLALLMSACGGGYEGTAPPIDSSNQALRLVGATNITLVPNEMTRIEIAGGARPFTATSGNTTVALASVSDNLLSVAGVRGDLTPTTVTVADARGARTTLGVTVTNSPQQGNFTLSERTFAVAPGASKDISLSGGTAPFTAAALSPLVTGVTVNGRILTVTGLSEGANAEIKVFDTKGVTQSALVTVAAPIPSPSGAALFSNIPANWSMRPRTAATYTLGGGTPPYSVTSTDRSVLSAEVRGAALMLQTGISGNSTLTVVDAAGRSLSYRLFVMTTSAPLTLSASAVSADVGRSETVRISGGMPPYTALTTATNLAGSGVVVNGDQLVLTGQFVGGPSAVVVRDSEGATARVDFTALPMVSLISASPSAITISELLTLDAIGIVQPTRIPVRVLRGRAPYQVFTSHPWLLRATVSGDVVTISTLSDGSGHYAPCVEDDTVVTISVIDATQAIAAIRVTIQDNGLVCPR